MSRLLNKVSRLKLLFHSRTGLFPQCILSGTRPLTFSYLSSPSHSKSPNIRLYSGTSIFVSDRSSKNVSNNFQYDHGLAERLADTKTLQKNLRLRGCNIDVTLLKEDYNRFCELEHRKLELEEKRQKISKIIAGLVKVENEQIVSIESTQQIKELREEGKQTREALKKMMTQFWDTEEKLMTTALSLPNDTLPHVTDKDEILDEYFQDSKLTIDNSHLEIIAGCKDVKFSNVGQKAYYLKGRLALLEQELIDRFSTELRNRDITPVLAPEMFKTPVVEAGGIDVAETDSVYRLHRKPDNKHLSDWDQENHYLRGASHLSFLAYFAKMNIKKDSLPIKMFTIGRNYVPENHVSKNLPGLLGVLQTIKICMCGVCDSQGASLELLQQFTTSLTEIYKNMGIPFRLVSVPISSLSASEQNRIEVQMWVPSLKEYLQVASLAVCGDYGSRRLMIRCSEDKQQSWPVYMVHCEVADITRLISIILEHGLTDQDWGTSFHQVSKIEVVDILD